MGKYDTLFQPMKIGNLTLKNKIAMAPMGSHAKNTDGSFNEDGVAYYVERAKGGVGLIVTTGITVQNKFDVMRATLATAGDSYIESSRKLTDAVHGYGTKIFLQLAAGAGRNRKKGFFLDDDPVSSSENPNVWDPTLIHRALTTEEVRFLIRSYADGAAIAKAAGFDGVEVHALHEGYLMDQFATACTNRRTDEYGGSLENRLRFATDTVKAIKEKCGEDYPVMIRYSVRTYRKGFGIDQGALPGEDFVEFGRDLEEGIQVAKLLEEAGYDGLDADNGSYESWYFAHPPVYMPKACNLEDAVAVKKAINIPVIVAGKMDDPDISAKAVEEGKVDAISIGRALLADPQWPNKVHDDEEEEIRPCIGCHAGCLERFFSGKYTSCALNPQTGCEGKYVITRAEKKKKVLVIGGGVGGMEAARVCALRGHDVELYEKTGELGGVFIAAASMDFKDDDKKLIRWYRRQMEKTGVKVHLNIPVTADMIREIGPDEIFVATGSSARKLKVEGADSDKVITAVEALRRWKPIGQKIVVIGGGLTGIEIAYSLTKDQGKQVEVIEMLPEILTVKGLNAANKSMLLNLIKMYEIPVHTSANVNKITSEGVEYTLDGKVYTALADTVIASIGYISDNSLYNEIVDSGVPTHLIGDAHQVSNLMGAIWDAFEIALNV